MTTRANRFRIPTITEDEDDMREALEKDPVTREELFELEQLRPKTRADCANVPRPCPFVSCKYNTLLRIKNKGREIAIPSKPIEDFPWTDEVPLRYVSNCVLDHFGGSSLIHIAVASNTSHQDVRLAMRRITAKITRKHKKLKVHLP